MSSVLWSVLRMGAAVYVGLCLVVWIRQGRYVYYPDRAVNVTPGDVGLDFEEVVIPTADGEKLAAWFVPGPEGTETAATVLFCHGNAGDIGDRLWSVRTFHALGMNVLIFDYRGYGNSSGRPTERGTYLDGRAVWDYLTGVRRIPARRIVLFGRSLGGAVASYLACEVAAGAAVLESTFSSAPDMARRMFPLLPGRLVCRFKYDTVSRAGRLKCPVLVAHSRDDEMIPFDQAERIFEACPEPKRFVAMRGGHNDGGLDGDEAYQTALREFVARWVRGEGPSPASGLRRSPRGTRAPVAGDR